MRDRSILRVRRSSGGVLRAWGLTVSLLVCGASIAASGAERMSFEQASKPFSGYRYSRYGYVSSTGQVTKGRLGCSGYATAVLYRMQNGNEWLKAYQADAKAGRWPYQWYGDRIAAFFKLAAAIEVSAADIDDPAHIRAMVDDKTLVAGGLYFFNVRNGKEGHVGFVRVGQDGELQQRQYSGLESYRGLATGDFRHWKDSTIYKDSPVQLYLVPE